MSFIKPQKHVMSANRLVFFYFIKKFLLRSRVKELLKLNQT